jgi:hypothetical protein
MKRVMRRRFIPSSYWRDLHNRLQTLKQGSKLVDEYIKEMELLLIRSDIREDEESRMARFLHGLDDDISSFVEMFPYQTLQVLVDQAMHTERKIQQEGRGRSYGGRSVSISWRWQQPSTYVGGVRSQGAQLGPLHPLVLQRHHSLVLLHLQISKKIAVLLQVRQLLQLHHPPHHLHIAEALIVTSAKVVGTLLLSVLVKGLCL